MKRSGTCGLKWKPDQLPVYQVSSHWCGLWTDSDVLSLPVCLPGAWRHPGGVSGWEDHCLPVSPGGRISLAVQVSWKANQSRCNSIVTNSFNCKVIVSVEQTSWLTNPKLKQGPGNQCRTLSIIWKYSCTIYYDKNKFQSKLGQIYSKSTQKVLKKTLKYPKVPKST